MSSYIPVIGLEIHAELLTKSKVFCTCSAEFGGSQNSRCCPVCTGMPGTLPVINQTAVEYAVKAGMALGCDISKFSVFDRKNYFYPDLPKAYQISQLYYPLCLEGKVAIDTPNGQKYIRINHIHLEEDAGKLVHDDFNAVSLADYNRCGIPLVEIVTEPDISSAEEAKAFIEKVMLLLQYAGVSDCKMEEGSLRCDVNVSVREKGATEFGTRCEMKNVNSFSAAVRGIEYEAKRQIEILEAGGTIAQETRRWDDVKGMSIVMRSKEDAQDYRYFPEPDLLTIVVPEEKIQALKESIPELPNVKLQRYVFDFGLSQTDATLIAEDISRSKMFDACVALGTCKPKSISNWILADIAKYTNETGKSIEETALTPEHLTSLIEQVEKGVISNASAKKVFAVIVEEDKDPLAIIEEKGMKQNSDTGFLEQLAKDVLAQNEKSVTDYKTAKTYVYQNK